MIQKAEIWLSCEALFYLNLHQGPFTKDAWLTPGWGGFCGRTFNCLSSVILLFYSDTRGREVLKSWFQPDILREWPLMALFDNLISSVKFDVLNTKFIMSFFKNTNSLVSTLPCLIVGGNYRFFNFFPCTSIYQHPPKFTEILKISYPSQLLSPPNLTKSR